MRWGGAVLLGCTTVPEQYHRKRFRKVNKERKEGPLEKSGGGGGPALTRPTQVCMDSTRKGLLRYTLIVRGAGGGGENF